MAASLILPRSQLRAIGLFVVTVHAALLMTGPAEAVKRKACMADHFHYGSSSGQPNKKAAEREAIASWEGFTAFEYGTPGQASNEREARTFHVRKLMADGAAMSKGCRAAKSAWQFSQQLEASSSHVPQKVR